MFRIFPAICVMFLFLGCTNAPRTISIHIFIPMEYTGWVNLVFNDSSKRSVEALKFNNGYVYLINGDPQEFRLKGDKFPPGKYDMHYYYYNIDTTIELSWAGYPKKNIFFERTIGSKSKNKYRSSLQTFTFYVSKELININGLSADMLPKNKIIE